MSGTLTGRCRLGDPNLRVSGLPVGAFGRCNARDATSSARHGDARRPRPDLRRLLDPNTLPWGETLPLSAFVKQPAPPQRRSRRPAGARVMGFGLAASDDPSDGEPADIPGWPTIGAGAGSGGQAVLGTKPTTVGMPGEPNDPIPPDAGEEAEQANDYVQQVVDAYGGLGVHDSYVNPWADTGGGCLVADDRLCGDPRYERTGQIARPDLDRPARRRDQRHRVGQPGPGRGQVVGPPEP